MNTNSQRGAVSPLLVASIILSLVCAGLAGFGVWAFMNYQDYKNNVDPKIASAVESAKNTQKAELEKQFIEREKQPYRQFSGPDVLGHVTFDYPKTWSVYIEDNGDKGTYAAYLHPGVVPPVSTSTPYATRVSIQDKNYDDVLKSFESNVKKGTLRSSPISVNNFTGIRLDGEFSKERTGTTVLFKIRDKTLSLSTDADAFKTDFDNVIVKSLDFNP